MNVRDADEDAVGDDDSDDADSQGCSFHFIFIENILLTKFCLFKTVLQYSERPKTELVLFLDVSLLTQFQMLHSTFHIVLVAHLITAKPSRGSKYKSAFKK